MYFVCVCVGGGGGDMGLHALDYIDDTLITLIASYIQPESPIDKTRAKINKCHVFPEIYTSLQQLLLNVYIDLYKT